MGAIRSFQGVQGTIGQPTAQVIDGSLSFKPTAWNSGSQRLERTPGSSSNRRTWTWSAWVKRGARFSGTNETHLFDSRVDDDDRFYGIAFTGPQDGEFLFVWEEISSGNYHYHKSTPSIRDNGWYHLVVAVDTTQSSGSDRVKFYANGELLPLAAENGSYPWYAQNYDTNVNQASSTHTIGSYYNQRNFDGYICQNYLIDGQALGPETFGFTDPLTNTWRPKKAKITGPNAGQIWSSNITLNSGLRGGGSGDAAMFDGILPSSYSGGGNFGGIQVSPSYTSSSMTINLGQTFTNVRVTIYPYFAASAATCKVDFGGGDIVTLSGSELNFGAYELGTHTFSSMTLTQVFVTGGGSNFGIGGIAIDGVMLINSTTNNFGPNGFYLPMDNDDFHIDKSGKGNDYTKVNFSGTSINPDIVKDSPSGAVFGGPPTSGITTTSSSSANYCTLNDINNINCTVSESNLKFVTGGNNSTIWSTMSIPTSGKYCFESTFGGGDMALMLDQEARRENRNVNQISTGLGMFMYYNTGDSNNRFQSNSTSVSFDSSFTTDSSGDVYMFEVDMDAGTVRVRKDDGSDSGLYTMPDALKAAPLFVGFTVTTTWPAVTQTLNFGQKPFKNTPSQGFLPLNSATVRPNKVIPRPDQNVGIVTYTGNASTKSVSGLNFNSNPDFVWIKQRSSSSQNHFLYDTVRGAGNSLRSSTTAQQQGTHTGTNGDLRTFDFNGFSLGAGTASGAGAVNENGKDIVAWCWKAGGNKNTFNVDDVGYASAAAAGLTGGDITPTGASVGTKQGFSIIKYDGSGTAGDDFPHGLLQTPEFIIVKDMDDTDNWQIYHEGAQTSGAKLLKFTDAAASSNTGPWNNTAPTSTLITLGDGGTNDSGNTHICYAWHSVPGLQKFGFYEGNGSTDGPYVELGFRPAVLLRKSIDSTKSWSIVDSARNPFNEVEDWLEPNTNSAEQGAGYADVDLLSNGFKVRTDGAVTNSSSTTYLYAAWAEAPASNLFGGQSNAR